MARHVSAIVSGAGWMASFTDRLLEGLVTRGCTNEEIHALVTSKTRPAMDKIADAVAELIRTMKNVFRLTKVGDGRTTEELVRDGAYNYVNPNIISAKFPVRQMKRGPREIVLLEFDHDPTSDEVLAEAERRGDLERPTYEDALYFGVEHPEVQRERPVVFLHEPVEIGTFSFGHLLYLWSSRGSRSLDLSFFGNWWNRNFRFAFVRKSSK